MTQTEFNGLRSGDRVRLSLLYPRGASLAGTVSRTGPSAVGVVWDGEPAGSYLRNSFFHAAWVRRYLRRLKAI